MADFTETLHNGIVKILNDKKDISVFLMEGLQQVIGKQAYEGLGDRSQYVGASDLDKCIRSVVLDKQRSVRSIDLKRALYFVRGHVAEMIAMLALRSEGITFSYQPEIIHPDKPHLKAHIDFLFERQARAHVLEIKCGTLRNDISFWQNQLDFQMGLVKLTRPEKHVTGSILNIDLTAAEVRNFNGQQYDVEAFKKCEERADKIWEVLHKETADEHAKRDILCAWCDHLEGCPAFAGKGYPQFPVLEDRYIGYESANAEKKSATEEYEFQRDGLLKILKGIGRRIDVGGWIIGPSKRTRPGGVDWAKLKAKDPETHDRIKKEFMKKPTEYYIVDSFEKQEPAEESETQKSARKAA